MQGLRWVFYDGAFALPRLSILCNCVSMHMSICMFVLVCLGPTFLEAEM